jgi:hypothetical protein
MLDLRITQTQEKRILLTITDNRIGISTNLDYSFWTFCYSMTFLNWKLSSHWTEAQATITRQARSAFVKYFLSYFEFHSFILKLITFLNFSELSCMMCIPNSQHCHPPSPRNRPTLWKRHVSAAGIIHSYPPKKPCTILPWNRVIFSVSSYLLYKEISYIVKACGLR